MNFNNITKCNICNAPLIFEELKTHTCFSKKAVEIRCDTRTNEYYVYDGKKWYRWFSNWLKKFSPTESQQRNKTTDEETEQNFINTNGIMCNIYIFICCL